MKKTHIVKVRKLNNAWGVLHPITGVQFVEHSVQAMKARVLNLYQTSKFVLGY